jgi:hypothetical protein
MPIRLPEIPLRGARITCCTWPGPNRYSLEYTVGSEPRFVNYSINDDGTYTFDYVDGAGNKRTEIYAKRRSHRPSAAALGTFNDNGDGTISDRATGLTWQRADGGEMIWESARSYCASLPLAGHRDWRLPTAHESFSILDHRLRPPALDLAVFPRSEAQYWWTADQRADDPSRVWVTNAGGGIGPHPKGETIGAGGDATIKEACVRGSTEKRQGWRDS